MSYLGLLINTCDVIRPTISDDHGTETKDYDRTSPVAEDLVCRIQYFSSMAVEGTGSLEPSIHGYEINEGYFAFFEFGANIQIDDMVVDDKGREFIVVSAPEDVTGMEHHIEVRLSFNEAAF